MAFDQHKNFAYSTVVTPPSTPTAGTSLVVTTGEGANFPTVPFNATVWPTGAQPTIGNAEIVRVTNITGDTLTITRTQESSTNRAITATDQISNSITTKVITDIETALSNTPWSSWAPSFSATTVGNGVVVAQFKQIGKVVHGEIGFTMGSTSSMGANSTFSLPVTGASRYAGSTTLPDIGTVYMEDAGVAGYHGICRIASTTTASVTSLGSAGTFVTNGGNTSTAPFTWGIGDFYIGSFVYEPA